MLNPRSRRLIGRFVRAYPARTAVTVALLLLAGLAEGMGIATVLPLLEVASDAGTPDDSAFSRLAVRALAAVDLSPTLPTLLVLIVGAIGLKGLFRWLAMRQVTLAVTRVAGDLRRRLLRAVMAARWRYFTGQPTGRFANALSVEAFQSSFAYRRACAAFAALIQVVVYVTIALLVSWPLAVLALAGGGAISAALSRFVRAGRRTGHDYTAAHQRMAALVTDVAQGVKAIKAMGREPRFLDALEERSGRLTRDERRLMLAHEALQSAHEPILAAAIAAGIFAAVGVIELPLSILVVMVFLFHRVVTRFHAVQREYQHMASLESAFWSIREQIAEAEAAAEPTGGTAEPPPLADAIVFDGVRFAHEEYPVLNRVDVRIPAGRFVAVVGRSGAGKTTLVDLLLGLYRPDAGEILVDGTPLSSIRLRAWRRRVGYIPQQTLLLHDTVAHNVGLGADGVDRAGIEAALRDAGASSFVQRLPDGIDTVVGERGARLSGGECQRIAIARALVARPTLLVLDEATAGLDAETEAAILDTLRDLRGRITVIAVSHHAAVAEAADVVYEIHDGRVRRRVAEPAARPTGARDARAD